jgi:predicted ATPase
MDLLRLRVEVSGEPDCGVEPSKIPRQTNGLTSQLQFVPGSSSRVYGRERELSQLKERYEAILQNSEREPELILLSGSSGMGKTRLAGCLIDEENTGGATFVQGKFELRQKDPYAPFASAVSMYIDNWQSMPAEQQLAVEDVRQRAQEAVGDEHALLSASIPALAHFLEEGRSSIPWDMSLAGPEASQRFRNLFCKLIASICSLQEPMILFIDDLQWAKQEPLALLAALLTDPAIQGLVIIGACRGDEVSVDDDLAVMLRDLEDNSGLKVTEVAVQGLAEEDITDVSCQFYQILRADECPIR